MASLSDDIQIVCDSKLFSILLGIQTATSMHGCPYCESFKVNMTLKIHIIIHHYRWYFTNTGKKFKDTNGEFGETVHSTFKKFELGRGFKVSRKLATDHHLLKAHQSISTFNALKMGGTPAKKMSIRKRKTSTSSSSPRSSPTSSPSSSSSWAFRKDLLSYHSLSPLFE